MYKTISYMAHKQMKSVFRRYVSSIASKDRSKEQNRRQIETVGDMMHYAIKKFTNTELSFGQSTVDPFQDAALMLICTLKLNVQDDLLGKWGKRRITTKEYDQLEFIIQKRITTRVPMAYLLKGCYQQGEFFFVDERTLIPRSFLAEILFSSSFTSNVVVPTKISSVLDLCTGSGCLAVLAAKVFNNAEIIVAIDVSTDALEVAKINISHKKLTQLITLQCGDLYSSLAREQPFDLIITNPPYVDTVAMSRLPAEYKHEPQLALDGGGKDGMQIVEKILVGASAHLRLGGGILIEVGRLGTRIRKFYPAFSREVRWLDTQQSSGECFYVTKNVLDNFFSRGE